jgi:hypothetical protein
MATSRPSSTKKAPCAAAHSLAAALAASKSRPPGAPWLKARMRATLAGWPPPRRRRRAAADARAAKASPAKFPADADERHGQVAELAHEEVGPAPLERANRVDRLDLDHEVDAQSFA